MNRYTATVSRIIRARTPQLNRFFAPTNTAAARKDGKYVQFDEELDISRFLSSEDKGATPHVVLKLCGVLVHTGSIASGHYYAYVRGAKDQWHCMGDEKVNPVLLKEVLGARAYMLFYTHPGDGWSGASALASAGGSTGDSGCSSGHAHYWLTDGLSYVLLRCRSKCY